MSALADHLADYLALRRGLGFKLDWEGTDLAHLVAYLDATGAPTLTAELAIAWARLPQGVQRLRWAHRLGAARGFARYLRAIDPATEVPPPDVFGARQQRRAPYLWAVADIGRLMEAARTLRPSLRAATHETLFGLLAVSGMRLGEAIGLENRDVDFAGAVLTIREAKFGRSRLVPLHPSAVEALRAYAARRDRLCPTPRSRTFFVSSVGTPLLAGGVQHTLNGLTSALELRTATVRPRLHDLRHTFAVRTLIEWQRADADVGARLPALSTYLGHVNPAGTYWYLSAVPELTELAAARLDARFGGSR
jgi:integrase/recombinase XerD